MEAIRFSVRIAPNPLEATSKETKEMTEDKEDSRNRSLENEYFVAAVCPSGRVVCARPSLALIDYYRTTNVLASEVKTEKPKESK